MVTVVLRGGGIELLAEPTDGEGCGQSGDGGRQARGPFGRQVQCETERGGPVIEDGLFEPRAAVETGSYPVAGLGHGAGDPGVARLVGTDEAEGAEVAEKAEADDGGRGENRGGVCFRR